MSFSGKIKSGNDCDLREVDDIMQRNVCNLKLKHHKLKRNN